MKKTISESDKILWTHHQIDNEDHFARGYGRMDMLYKKIKKKVPIGKRILDVGCGDGYLLSKLAKHYRCQGVDISAENIRKLSKRYPEISFKLVDTDGILPFKDEYFDVCVASEVLEHMDNKELEVSIKEIHRILKEGGTAFVTFPAEEDLSRNSCFCPHCKKTFHRWGHKQRWSREVVKKKFNIFKKVNIAEYLLRYKGEDGKGSFLGFSFWVIQNIIDYISKTPAKLLMNKIYVVVCKK